METKNTQNHENRRLSLSRLYKDLDEADYEEVIQQYDAFLDHIPAIGSFHFTSFNQYKNRVDTFLMEHMTSPRFKKLQRTVKLLLILSHGQATVERGFSVNKEVECENMKEQTLVAQRLVYDHIKQVDGVLNVPISNKHIVMLGRSMRLILNYKGSKNSNIKQRKRKMLRPSTPTIDYLPWQITHSF